MPRRVTVLLLALALSPATGVSAQSFPAGRPASLGFSVERLARIDTLLQSYVDQGRTPGVVALIIRRGQVAWSASVGLADRESHQPMRPDALFRIASQTKAVTSVAAMVLVEEGRLRLDDPVSRFLPGFAEARVAVSTDSGRTLVAVEHRMTIRDLLTQTAGLSYGTESLIQDDYRAAGLGPAAGYGWYLADKAEPVCATMDRLGTLPLAAQPEEVWIYGYASDVLGCVVERASGMPLDRFLQERIFIPLRMHETWFFPPDSVGRRLTAVYSVTPDGALVRAPAGPMGQGDYLAGPRQNFSGGAGLVSTAGDYARFLQMLLNGGELDGARVLSPATVSLMTRDQVGTLYEYPGLGFGLGFEVLEDPGLAGEYGSVGRFGWGGAYATKYWVDPTEELVVVLMQQLLPARGLDLSSKFRTMVYAALIPPARAKGH
ncbi:MAG TPA: serine hydrolase domain-containing protein [Gemmatimonadales bacterium]|nr:serine hydrolase domain-containing protein [Gemmatimonadales bacterium]